MLLHQTGKGAVSGPERLSTLRKFYETRNIENQVEDGGVPFPENEQSIRDGISLEFRYFVQRLGFFIVMLIRQL